MALINKKEINNLSVADLKNKLVEIKKQLMKHNAQIAIGIVPKSPGLVKETKKAIAKIKTILHQKEETKIGGK